MTRQKLFIDLVMVHVNQEIQEIQVNQPSKMKEEPHKDSKINDTITEQPKNSICGCYNKDKSNDMRLCGICYCYNNNLNKEEQCSFCPETFHEYYNSGYIITSSGFSKTGEPCEDCFCTGFCLPVKFPLFFTCCLGSICNNMINCCRDTNANYLC